jgi:hypothetical protein
MKKVIIIVASIIALPLILALFVSKDYVVVRTIEVNRPSQEVFDYVKYVKNQDFYSVWNMRDPNMQKGYSGTDGEVGFVYSWNSTDKEMGIGEQEIIGIEPGKRIDFELRFIEPFEGTEKAYISTEAMNAKSTKVTWGFDGHMAYPMNIMMLFMDFEEMIGSDLQSGLDQLKTVVEAMPMDTLQSDSTMGAELLSTN